MRLERSARRIILTNYVALYQSIAFNYLKYKLMFFMV
jgi:hypothetical protein